MKLIFIFGPQAVGKMTVGQELEKKIGFPLLHNHLTIDLLSKFLDYTPETFRLSSLIRKNIFQSMIKMDKEGIIFTMVWDFDSKEDWQFIEETRELILSAGGEIFFVELEADIDERLARNLSANRLKHKPSKRDTEHSEKDLLESLNNHRLNSREDEIQEKNYVRIKTTDLSAEETAEQIKHVFKLS